jgi:hypothetical protein
VTPEALSEVQRRNVAIAKRVSELNERGGVEAVESAFDEFFHPDFEWMPGLAGLGAEVYRGRDGFREFIADMNTIATDSPVTVAEIRAVGETHILTSVGSTSSARGAISPSTASTGSSTALRTVGPGRGVRFSHMPRRRRRREALKRNRGMANREAARAQA